MVFEAVVIATIGFIADRGRCSFKHFTDIQRKEELGRVNMTVYVKIDISDLEAN